MILKWLAAVWYYQCSVNNDFPVLVIITATQARKLYYKYKWRDKWRDKWGQMRHKWRTNENFQMKRQMKRKMNMKLIHMLYSVCVVM